MWIQKHQYSLSLAVIICIAAFLRFFHFLDLPYMWDELSALHRLRFNGFSELIKHGVKPDGHPAGVQVFLYYWTLLFGKAEWIVKLPFNLMGLASVYLIYSIGKTWFGEKSGIIAASFMATLQFFVLYSPIARPYISGLFLTLMMVHYWSLYMFQNPSKKYLTGFIIFAALSAYNHHFSLLFAAIVGFSGLFTIHKNQAKEYIIAGVLIFVLYLPHMPIFIHQLGIGGIGGEGLWLAQPNYSFPLEFIDWAFQFSSTILLLAAALLAYSILGDKNPIPNRKIIKNTLLISWFSMPLIIGLGYSLYINPVIQYSMLIYSFPYLLLLLGSGIEKMKWWAFYPTFIVILMINSFTLINQRNHYRIIVKQPFDITAQILQENPDNTFTIFNTIEAYQRFYFDKYKIDNAQFLNTYKKELNNNDFAQIIKSRKEDFILTCGILPEYIPIIEQYYPYLIRRENGYTMETYLFSRQATENYRSESLITSFHHNSTNNKWQYNDSRISSDSLGSKQYEFNNEQEWGLSFTDSINALNIEYGCILDLVAEVRCDSSKLEAMWIATILLEDGEKIWRGKQTALIPTKEKGTYKLYHSIDTRILLSSQDWDKSIFQTYFWNKNHENFQISNIKISQRPNNPIRYGLFEKLP